jgi:hypothetical protein
LPLNRRTAAPAGTCLFIARLTPSALPFEVKDAPKAPPPAVSILEFQVQIRFPAAMPASIPGLRSGDGHDDPPLRVEAA